MNNHDKLPLEHESSVQQERLAVIITAEEVVAQIEGSYLPLIADLINNNEVTPDIIMKMMTSIRERLQAAIDVDAGQDNSQEELRDRFKA